MHRNARLTPWGRQELARRVEAGTPAATVARQMNVSNYTTPRGVIFTTTGWMMWNYLVSGLLAGATIVLFDGDPGAPSLDRMWQLCDEEKLTWFGTSAPFLMACHKADLRPGSRHDLTALRAVGSTGAPLPADGFRWVYEAVKPEVLLSSISGGTDVCTAFMGMVPVLPVHAGEISCAYLGRAVDAVDGELVITKPMPSMPMGFWHDDDGSRFRAAYFEAHPGIWTHGDWLETTEHGGYVISGRSDASPGAATPP